MRMYRQLKLFLILILILSSFILLQFKNSWAVSDEYWPKTKYSAKLYYKSGGYTSISHVSDLGKDILTISDKDIGGKGQKFHLAKIKAIVFLQTHKCKVSFIFGPDRWANCFDLKVLFRDGSSIILEKKDYPALHGYYKNEKWILRSTTDAGTPMGYYTIVEEIDKIEFFK